MTIISTAYQSTPCKDYLTKRIAQGLTDRLVTSRLLKVREGIYAVPPSQYDPSVATLAVFNYPMVIEHRGEQSVVFDARTLLTTTDSGELVARRFNEFQARIVFSELVREWNEGDEMRLLSFNQMPLGVYANWLAEVIAKRFALNAQSQMQVGIIAGIYYTNLFGENVINQNNGAETIVAISRATGFRSSDVALLVEAYPEINSLEEFCEACREYTQDVHLRDLNVTTLYGTVGGYWYGNAGRESIAVALEYPPMWLTLLFQAITDRSFKKSGLTGVVERNTWRKHHSMFVQAMMQRSEATSMGSLRTNVY